MIAIVGFTVFEGLTDEHLSQWLADYFRASNENGGVGLDTRKDVTWGSFLR